MLNVTLVCLLLLVLVLVVHNHALSIIPTVPLYTVPLYTVFQHDLPYASQCNITLAKVPTNSTFKLLVKLHPFHLNSQTLSFRLTPDAVGTFTYQTDCPRHTRTTNSFLCVKGNNTGGLLRNPTHTTSLQKQGDTNQFFTIGLEVDWLFALNNNTNPTLSDFMKYISNHGVNTILTSIYSNYSSWNEHLPDRISPKVSPTLITPFSENGLSLNYAFFEHWDDIFTLALSYDIQLHVMHYVGNKNVQWPTQNSALDEQYWTHILSRYNAFPNLIMDVSKETAGYGVGISYMMSRLEMMHSMNIHQRLITAHSGLIWTNDCPQCNLTMVTAQTHYQNHTDTGKWYQNMLDLRTQHPTLPVLQAEFMYESGEVRGCHGSPPGNLDCMTTQQGKDDMRYVLWDMYFAGGNGAVWYNCDTAWDVISIASPAAVGMLYLQSLSLFWKYVVDNVVDVVILRVVVVNNSQPQQSHHHHMLATENTLLVHLRSSMDPSDVVQLPPGIVKNGGFGRWHDPSSGMYANVTVQRGAPSFVLKPPLFLSKGSDMALVLTAAFQEEDGFSIGFGGMDVVACVEMAMSAKNANTTTIECTAVGNRTMSTTYTSVDKSGDPKYSTTLYFTSVDNMIAFENAPFSYLPKYGGFDGLQIGNGTLSSWNATRLGPSVDLIHSWRVVDDSGGGGELSSVYLFANVLAGDTFVSGLPETKSRADKKWEEWFGTHGTEPPYAVNGGPLNSVCFTTVPNGSFAVAGRNCVQHPQDDLQLG